MRRGGEGGVEGHSCCLMLQNPGGVRPTPHQPVFRVCLPWDLPFHTAKFPMCILCAQPSVGKAGGLGNERRPCLPRGARCVCVWGCAERPVNLARVEREERIIRMSGESGRSALILALSAWSSRCAPYPLPPTAPARTPCLSLSLTTAPRVLSGRLPSSTSSSSTRVTPAPPQLSAQWPLLREASPTFPGRPPTAPVINPAWPESSMR